MRATLHDALVADKGSYCEPNRIETGAKLRPHVTVC